MTTKDESGYPSLEKLYEQFRKLQDVVVCLENEKALLTIDRPLAETPSDVVEVMFSEVRRGQVQQELLQQQQRLELLQRDIRQERIALALEKLASRLGSVPDTGPG